MATLTHAVPVHEYDVAYRLLSGWLHKHGRLWFPEYLAVPELHPGGHGWHWHLLHSNRPSKHQLHQLRQSWSRYLARHGYAAPGQTVQVHLKHHASARLAANYAAKYVGKSLDSGAVGPGRHSYLRSEGLSVVRPRLTYVPCLDDAVKVLEGLGWFFIDGRTLPGQLLFVWGESP
jgi:hypothetical protein